MKFLPVALCCWFAAVTIASADCANFVSPPMLFERGSWSELENYEASKSLNASIDEVQTISGKGQGKLNIDQYSIVIDKTGESASDALKNLRLNLSDVVFTGSYYSDVRPLDAASEALWKSDNYSGAVMVFTLASVGVVDLETGAVVVSCTSPTNFIFSTVRVGSANTYTSPGWHPVSGNRAFGVRDNGDDSLTIFVKAADRVVDAGIFSTKLVSNEKMVFGPGHKVWLNMLKNIKTKYASRNPRNEAVFSERVDY